MNAKKIETFHLAPKKIFRFLFDALNVGSSGCLRWASRPYTLLLLIVKPQFCKFRLHFQFLSSEYKLLYAYTYHWMDQLTISGQKWPYFDQKMAF